VLAAKPRGLIILTQCCSGYEGRGLQPALDSARAKPEVPNNRTVRNLVLGLAGVVSITAADDGKTSWTGWNGPNPGQAGCGFTVAMVRLWYRHDVTFTTWKQFFPVLRSETGKASNGQQFARAFELPR
jgi:hypothetical protein